jgi:DNA-binding LacI/PurR family transcriptional regulator
VAKQRVTIRLIARRLGLSPATVSTALTGRRNGIFVSPGTREKVRHVAQSMGYALDRLRRRPPTLQRIALLCPPRSDFISAIVPELCQLLTQQDYRVLVHSDRDRRRASKVAQELHRRYEIDGIIYVGSRNSPDEMAADLPGVVLGEVPDNVNAWRVCVDNEGGGQLAGEHLWSLGHRRAGMVAWEGNRLPSEKRLRGLRSVWERNGATLPAEGVIRIGEDSEEEVYTKLAQVFHKPAKRRLPLTALFCYNDRLAGMTIKALRRLGLRVPEDVSVVGFDDAVYAELLDPPLTTVQQPVLQLGTLATQLLQERLNAPAHPPKSLALAGRLVVRQSTAPPGTGKK